MENLLTYGLIFEMILLCAVFMYTAMIGGMRFRFERTDLVDSALLLLAAVLILPWFRAADSNTIVVISALTASMMFVLAGRTGRRLQLVESIRFGGHLDCESGKRAP